MSKKKLTCQGLTLSLCIHHIFQNSTPTFFVAKSDTEDYRRRGYDGVTDRSNPGPLLDKHPRYGMPAKLLDEDDYSRYFYTTISDCGFNIYEGGHENIFATDPCFREAYTIIQLAHLQGFNLPLVFQVKQFQHSKYYL